MANTQARVRVQKVTPKKWRVFNADGSKSVDFSTKSQALSAAYSYARYTLGNQSMFMDSCITPEGFEL